MKNFTTIEDDMVLDGVHYKWGKMTPEQKQKKKAAKIAVAGSKLCPNKEMLEYWQNVSC